MAKGKHSTALFEVIHNARRPERAAQSLRTPKWWFKGRPAGSGTPEPRPAPATTEPAPASEPVAAQAPAPAPARPAAPRSNRYDRSSAVHVEFDRDRKEITLRLRYTTAIVSAFTVCVLVGLAYIAGRHISRGPQLASASEGQEISRLRELPPQQGVADVRHHHSSATQQGSIANEPPRRIIERQAPPTPREPQTQVPGIESRLPRTIGLNYVVIQSYPKDRIKAAQQAAEVFTQSGIPCTIMDLHQPGWVQLVGTAGFKHVSGSEYRGYLQSITAVWDKSSGAKFDQVKPYGYKWKGTETPAE